LGERRSVTGNTDGDSLFYHYTEHTHALDFIIIIIIVMGGAIA